MNNENTSHPRLGDDPQNNLRIENEILHMKLRAQFGGVSATGDNVSPEGETSSCSMYLPLKNSMQMQL